jgi:mannosyl-oligosaccharide glucosidase
MILGLLSPESKRLKATIDLIKNPQELWTSHGVLSLSQSDKYFGTGENYWRGPIWINVNFLILKSLKTVGY